MQQADTVALLHHISLVVKQIWTTFVLTCLPLRNAFTGNYSIAFAAHQHHMNQHGFNIAHS